MIIQKEKDKQVLQEEEFYDEDNSAIKAYYAIKEILSHVVWTEGRHKGKPVFKTIKYNQGQYQRIVRKESNREFEIAFPAAFVEFVDLHFNVSQQVINEGRGTMKIKCILNKLNNMDNDIIGADGRVIEYNEMSVYHVAQLITNKIAEEYMHYPALQTRCNLQYIDPMECMNDGLQPFWITYEVWFREETYMSRRYTKEINIVFPPFANHADQLPENNPENHTNADHIESMDKHSHFQDLAE